jgi:hypothetical protein
MLTGAHPVARGGRQRVAVDKDVARVAARRLGARLHVLGREVQRCRRRTDRHEDHPALRRRRHALPTRAHRGGKNEFMDDRRGMPAHGDAQKISRNNYGKNIHLAKELG